MAVICSLLATCKAHDVNPRLYLNSIIADMPYQAAFVDGPIVLAGLTEDVDVIFEDCTFGGKDLDVEKLPDDLRKLIGYRVPTEDKYSMAPLIIKGFLPQQNGSSIMLPADITQIAGSDFDVDKAKVRGLGLMLDIIGAFSPRIIASLTRRMNACQNLLINHINDIEYNDGMHICWRRKDGQYGDFNVPSYQAMQDAITVLELSRFKEFVTKKIW